MRARLRAAPEAEGRRSCLAALEATGQGIVSSAALRLLVCLLRERASPEIQQIQGCRAQSLYCAITATGRPIPLVEVCSRNGAIKRLRPTALRPWKRQAAGS